MNVFGIHIDIYYSFHVLGFLIVAVYMLLFAKKYSFKKYQGLVLTTLCYITMYLVMLSLFYIITGKFGGQNIVRVFPIFPLIAYLFAKSLNMNTDKAFDLLAPAPCIVQGISHIGCIFAGCCESFLETDFGIYNPIHKTKLFPIQLFESATALIIAGILIFIAIKKKYQTNGMLMPYMLIMFGSTRFLWEFLRDNDKLFWEISGLALWALGSVIVGIIIIIFKKRNFFKKA